LTTWKVGQISMKFGGLSPAPTPAAPQPGPNPAFAEIRAAVEARDYARAGELAERALAEGLEHPVVLNLAALKCEQEERFDDAIALLERALVLAPDDVALPPHRSGVGEKQNKMVGHRRVGLKPDAAAALRHIQHGAGTKRDAGASGD